MTYYVNLMPIFTFIETIFFNVLLIVYYDTCHSSDFVYLCMIPGPREL